MGDCASCAVTGHLWSLAVEEHFYLVMPLALLLCGFAPRRMAVLFLVAIIGAAAWRTYALTVLHMPEVYTYKATESRIDSIAWGCLAAVIDRAWPAAMNFVKRRAWLVFGAGCALMLASLAYRDPIFRETLRYSVQGLALVGIVLPLVVAPQLGGLVKLLEIAPLRWMGRRSYAAYLWHMLALTLGGMIVGFTGIIENAPGSPSSRPCPSWSPCRGSSPNSAIASSSRPPRSSSLGSRRNARPSRTPRGSPGPRGRGGQLASRA